MANFFEREVLGLVIKLINLHSEDGRLKELMAEFGLTENHVNLLSQLNHAQVERIAQSRIQPFRVAINHESMTYIQQLLSECALQDRCIRLGAPNDFLAEFFGIGSREAYAKRVLNAIDAKRVKRVARFDLETLIINKYHTLSHQCTKELGPREFCEICEALNDDGIPCNLKLVWQTIKAYRADCEGYQKAGASR